MRTRRDFRFSLPSGGLSAEGIFGRDVGGGRGGAGGGEAERERRERKLY
jgi:hypothetical protein